MGAILINFINVTIDQKLHTKELWIQRRKIKKLTTITLQIRYSYGYIEIGFWYIYATLGKKLQKNKL